MPAMHDPDPNEEHELDYDDIDELDELGAGEQLVSIWCHIHGDYEWHWVGFEDLPFR
jgi:hypothetical protein